MIAPAGANVDHANNDEKTALIIGSIKGLVEIVQIILTACKCSLFFYPSEPAQMELAYTLLRTLWQSFDFVVISMLTGGDFLNCRPRS